MKTSLLLVLVTGMFLVLTAGSCLQGKHIVGSKNYISKEVKADHFNEIKLVGSANISCYASQKLVARVKGSGDIAYKGDPQEVDAPRKNIRQIK